MQVIQRLSELTADWNYFTGRDGLMAAIGAILTDVAKLPYRHLHFVTLARSLLDPLPNPQPKVGLVLRLFEQRDLDWVRQNDRPSEANLCAQRLKQGHKGLIAFHKSRPVGYAWGSGDLHTRLERVHPPLNPGDVLFTDAYTHPAFRGLGVQTALTLARFRMFKELGYLRAISTIEVDNTASLAVWERKLNSQFIGTIDFKRIGPWYKIQYC